MNPSASPRAHTPTLSEQLVPFLEDSAHAWLEVTSDVDADTLVLFGLVEAIRRAWQSLRRSVLVEFDLNHAEWTTLGILRTSPPAFRRSPTELRHLVGQTSAGMTRILTKLTHAGLVRRMPSPDDGRGRDVILTHRGRLVAERSFRALHDAERDLMANLPSSSRTRTIATLGLTLDALTADDAPTFP